MARKPLSYEQNLRKRGFDGVDDRLRKNGVKFNAKIFAAEWEQALIVNDMINDVDNYASIAGEHADTDLVVSVLDGTVVLEVAETIEPAEVSDADADADADASDEIEIVEVS